MKKKWTNNLGIKILSVAIAFLLWVVIINIEDPTTSRTFRVKVEIQNDEIVASSHKVYKITEGEFVDVTVKGNKSYIDSLTDKDITATADFRYLSNYGSVPITAKCTKYTTTKYTVELGSVDHVLVELEAEDEAKFIVRFNIVAEPPTGYYVDTNLITSNPTKITVKGGESIIKSISAVEVDVDASKHTSDFTDKLVPKVYDSSGNQIDSANIECSVSEVTVNVTVLQTKKLPVNVTITGEPANGYKAEAAVYDPTEIVVAGDKNDLMQINSVELTVPVDGATSSVEHAVDLIKDGILPDNIYIDSEKTNVAIEVPVVPLESKEITFNPTDIGVKMPSGAGTYSFENPEQEFKVKVYAVKDDLDKVSIDTLKPTIDLSDKKYGKYNVEIKFSDYYLVEPVGDIKVKVTLAEPVSTDDQGGTANPQTPAPTTSTPEPTKAPTTTPERTEPAKSATPEEAVTTD